MGIVKKKLELDEQLFTRIQELYGDTVSLTAIVSVLLEELIAVHDEERISFRTLTNKAARQAKDALSLSSEIQSSHE